MLLTVASIEKKKQVASISNAVVFVLAQQKDFFKVVSFYLYNFSVVLVFSFCTFVFIDCSATPTHL